MLMVRVSSPAPAHASSLTYRRNRQGATGEPREVHELRESVEEREEVRVGVDDIGEGALWFSCVVTPDALLAPELSVKIRYSFERADDALGANSTPERSFLVHSSSWSDRSLGLSLSASGLVFRGLSVLQSNVALKTPMMAVYAHAKFWRQFHRCYSVKRPRVPAAA